MANRMEGNVYIIDSAFLAATVPWNAGSKVMAFAFWSTSSSGEVVFSGSDTSNIISRIASPSNGNSAQTAFQYLGGVQFSQINVPILTAGTAWIYFS